jgi:GT2 family glycosyltransferase/glycosyltransferase involved in cell wall biosynthesis
MQHIVAVYSSSSLTTIFEYPLRVKHNKTPVEDFHISIIVPVFGAPSAVERCLRSISESQTSISFDVTVIDDFSPNPDDRTFVRDLSNELGYKFIQNMENLGFVRTSNIGLLNAAKHALLLNSDTQVFNYWLEAFANSFNDETGTITPISNNATIFSIPSARDTNIAVNESYAKKMASTLRSIDYDPWEIPTAHGFCMFISQRALGHVGILNFEAFGHGYGEENDYSMRVTDSGLKNLLTPKTYVYHEGSASFGQSVSARQKIAHETLVSLWPEYPVIISQYLETNPLIELESISRVQNLVHQEKKVDLHFSHKLGGGVDKAVRLECEKSLEQGVSSIVVRPGSAPNSITLEGYDAAGSWRIPIEFMNSALSIANGLKKLPLRNTVVHHQIEFLILEDILEAMNCDYTFRIHDYYTICPFINLADGLGRYCGEPQESGCNSCISQRRPEVLDIETWRITRSKILYGAQAVSAPSSDTKKRIQRYFPNLRIEEKTNPSERLTKVSPNNVSLGTIAILGELSTNKGIRIVKLLLELLPMNFNFTLVGFIPEQLFDSSLRKSVKTGRLVITGAYFDDSQALHLLRGIGPSKIFFPGQIPETYSYTLDIAMALGVPIVACNIGAAPERLSDYKGVELFDKNDSMEILVNMLIR